MKELLQANAQLQQQLEQAQAALAMQREEATVALAEHRREAARALAAAVEVARADNAAALAQQQRALNDAHAAALVLEAQLAAVGREAAGARLETDLLRQEMLTLEVGRVTGWAGLVRDVECNVECIVSEDM